MDKKILRAAAISLGAAVGSASAHEAEPSQGDTTAVSLANIEIVANRANEKTPVAFTNEGQAIKHELDSLIAIPDKSHEDSIGIIRRYGYLENIVKSLKQNDND